MTGADAASARTLAWYEGNAEAYAAATDGIPMDDIRGEFLALLPDCAEILEVGPGSGRDARAFADGGHRVVAIEPVAAFADALVLDGRVSVIREPVEHMRFEPRFDGVWACGSLLHVASAELPAVFRRLAGALRAGGAMFVCFKHGSGESVDADGRAFVDMDEDGLAGLLSGCPGLTLIRTWLSPGRAVRPGVSRMWFNALLAAS